MRSIKSTLAIVHALVTVMLFATGATAAGQGSHRTSLDAVRNATARYHVLSIAEHHGYTLLRDKNGITCIANPGVGAMGVHYVNGGLVGSGKINALKPQVLVYEPRLTDEQV
jgi:hypothetical protein